MLTNIVRAEAHNVVFGLLEQSYYAMTVNHPFNHTMIDLYRLNDIYGKLDIS